MATEESPVANWISDYQEWFNDFDKDENKIKELISRLSRARQIIYNKTIKRVPRDKMIHNIIGEISKFISSLS